MGETERRQAKATAYYQKFSIVYDALSPKAYYHEARSQAIKELHLKKGMTVLNITIGTGQNIEYFQSYLHNTGQIIGVDLSPGMLAKAEAKIETAHWKNVTLIQSDVLALAQSLTSKQAPTQFDAILCDLGLSGFPEWQNVIDTLVSMLKVGGRIVIMDWYIKKATLRGEFIKWIGKGEVNRPLWQYLETKVDDFSVDSSFNRGGVFVAAGSRQK